MDGKSGCIGSGVHLTQFAVHHLEQAVVGADPNTTLTILDQTTHEAIAQTVGLGKGAKDSILEMHQAPAFGPQPQAAIARAQYAEDAIVGHSRGCRMVIEVEV